MLEVLKGGNETAIAGAQKSLMLKQQDAFNIRKEALVVIKKDDPGADVNDGNYIFLHFVIDHLPQGLVGLLLAIIFLAAMGSTASGLNALTSACVIDFYKRFINPTGTEKKYLYKSRLITLVWGVFCIFVALYAGRLGNLIEAVNILGSLFYGTILGIFLTAFFTRSVGGKAVFISAVFTELFVVACWWYDVTAFLWLNLIGSVMVLVLSLLIQKGNDAYASMKIQGNGNK